MTTNSYHIPPCNGVYLLHASLSIGSSHPKGSAQHYIGYGQNMRKRFLKHKQGKSNVDIVNAMLEAGATLHVARIWPGANRVFESRMKANAWGKRLCPICNPTEWFKRGMKLEPEELTDGLPFGVDLRNRWPTPFIMEQKFRRFWPMSMFEVIQCQAHRTTLEQPVRVVEAQGSLLREPAQDVVGLGLLHVSKQHRRERQLDLMI